MLDEFIQHHQVLTPRAATRLKIGTLRGLAGLPTPRRPAAAFSVPKKAMSLPTPLLERLHKLESRLRLLLDRLHVVNRQLADVERERDGLRRRLDEQQEENRRLSQQLKEAQKKPTPVSVNFHKSDKNRKLVGNLVPADNPAELKDKLDEYIREIDQCIAYLSSSNTL